MKTQAAVLFALNRPVEVVDLELPALRPGQVLIEVQFSGVCHTQVLEVKGRRGEDKFLPHCLGHEGSGRVLEVGPGVQKVKPGDSVILSWMAGSGATVPGTIYQYGDIKVNAGPLTTFSRHTVVSESRVHKVVSSLSPEEACLMGCALPTGLGSVFNTLQARPGQSLVVFGVGGIGMSALAGAVVSGCSPVIAVDLIPSKLEIAKTLGATHTLQASQDSGKIVEAIRAICPQGADYAVEATGRPAVMAQALASVRSRGGSMVVVGNAHFGESFQLNPAELNQGKRVFGTWGGDNDPDLHFARYSNLVATKRLNVAPFFGKQYKLEELNEAIEDLEAGRVMRPILRMS